jgi:hypothetical protein
MLARDLLTMLSRLPHDAVILIDTGKGLKEIESVIAEMSTDLYEARDHIIIKL